VSPSKKALAQEMRLLCLEKHLFAEFQYSGGNQAHGLHTTTLKIECFVESCRILT
jgi:hypothetical protein